MKPISEVIVDWMDNTFKDQPKLYRILEGNQLFWQYVRELFNHPQFQQFSLLKMHLPQSIASKLSLRHNQQLEVYGKDTIVSVRPDELWESVQNTFDVVFEPIE